MDTDFQCVLHGLIVLNNNKKIHLNKHIVCAFNMFRNKNKTQLI